MATSRLDTLAAYLEDDPTDPFLHFAFAMELVKVGSTMEAIRTFETLVRDHPDYVGTYYHLAKLYASSKRLEDARTTIEAGIKVANRQGEARTSSELRQLMDDLNEE